MPLCFDLDGTLGSFGGGYLLLRETLAELWGAPVEKAELDACVGSTDWEIVDELHRARFGRGLEDAGYAAFESACLAKFRATFHPAGRAPVPHAGLIEGLGILLDLGHGVWLVSGNSPAVLEFKAEALKLDPRILLLGSRPAMTARISSAMRWAEALAPTSTQATGPTTARPRPRRACPFSRWAMPRRAIIPCWRRMPKPKPW